MIRRILVAAAISVGASGAALAQSREGLAGYSVSAFETHRMQVAVATDTQSGRRVNVVRLGSGRMMVLIPAATFMGLMPFSDDAEMIGAPRDPKSR